VVPGGNCCNIAITLKIPCQLSRIRQIAKNAPAKESAEAGGKLMHNFLLRRGKYETTGSPSLVLRFADERLVGAI
jgi:hypothetical protein